MAQCLFCKSHVAGAHTEKCPFNVDPEKRSAQLSQAEYELFEARAQEWLDEEDSSKPDMTLTLTKGSMICMMKMIRDALLPPPGKDPSVTSFRATSQLLVEGEKFLGALQQALTAAGPRGDVGFDPNAADEDDDDDDDTEDATPPPPQMLPPAPKQLTGKAPGKKRGK